MPEGVKRKISAILSADVVGYSKLMEADEESTVRTMESYRKTVVSLVGQHDGKAIDSPGDNILSEFSSVVDAAQCAVEIQHVIKAKNAVLPEARRMEFRIGINLGDLIEEDGRTYGDGVNIASRIESLADAGGICVSDSAYQQIENKLALGYEDIGEQALKNISKPIRVYRIPLDSSNARAGISKTEPKRFQWAALALICIAIGAGAVIAWNQIQETQEEPETAKEESAATAHQDPSLLASEKPSIAVLPFDNMSNDPDQEYFSDGLSEDLLNGLAKSKDLKVIARTSSFSFKGQNRDIRNIGKQLNATHVVEGSVRRAGKRIRVTAQLINAKEGIHLWSEQYDRELTDMFEVQDDITGEILAALDIHLSRPREGSRGTVNMKAYSFYLLGRNHLNSYRLDQALEAFEKAVLLDPQYADAYGAIAYAYNLYLWFGAKEPRDTHRVIRRNIERALLLDSDQPDALNVDAQIRFFVDREYQRGLDAFGSLILLYPNNHNIWRFFSYTLNAIGRHDISLEISEMLIKTDPMNPLVHLNRAVQLILQGRGSEAADYYQSIIATEIGPSQFAWLHFLEGDVEALEKLLNKGRQSWGFSVNWYPIFEATASYMKGNQDEVDAILRPLWQQESYQSFWQKTWMAFLERNLDLSLIYYREALDSSEYTAFNMLQYPPHLLKAFPDFRSHPKYHKLVRDAGLDEESIAKLKIPPLPF